MGVLAERETWLSVTARVRAFQTKRLRRRIFSCAASSRAPIVGLARTSGQRERRRASGARRVRFLEPPTHPDDSIELDLSDVNCECVHDTRRVDVCMRVSIVVCARDGGFDGARPGRVCVAVDRSHEGRLCKQQHG